jgi:arabinogalactan oligomer/maltooligosaccharide transport system substrate-binding protein
MKKHYIPLIMFLVFLLALTGCANPAPNPPPADTGAETSPAGTASPASTAGVPIVSWTNFQVEAEMLQNFADQWAAETGNQATVSQVSIELQEFAQASGTEGGPDGIFGIANDQLASFVAAGLVEEVPADLYQDEDFVGASVQASYVNGKRFGVPVAVETITLFYNTDKAPTPPATWDELLAAAKTNGGIKFDATSIYYDLGFFRAFDSYIFNWENNAYNVDDIGLGNAGALEAYRYINSMVGEGSLSADITFDIARSAFENNETAYYIGGPWDVEAFTSAGVNFDVSVMPTLNGKPFVTPVGTQVGFVSSKSGNKEVVWDFYRYLLDNAMVELYEVGSRIPASLNAQSAITIDETTKSFMDQIANGEPLPSVPEMGQIWTPFADNMRLLFGGTTTPDATAANIDAQFKEAIALMHEGQ